MAGGLSKVCIGHNDLERWVIKVGYTENVKIDHAAREYDNYCLAVEEGLACYFPTTIYLGTFGGRPFYVQEKAICNENQITSNWYDCLCDEFECAGRRYDPDEIWDTIWDMSDEERADLTFHDDELTVFLAENRIGDLHEGNFGTIGGLLVIIDFSGWFG